MDIHKKGRLFVNYLDLNTLSRLKYFMQYNRLGQSLLLIIYSFIYLFIYLLVYLYVTNGDIFSLLQCDSEGEDDKVSDIKFIAIYYQSNKILMSCVTFCCVFGF